jgi:2-oxoisovalerate dehydrogenase E1 component
MLRGAVAMAAEDGRVVVFLEPIALYHEKDLHADGDEGWLSDYPPPPEALLPGDVGLYAEADEDADVLLVSYANGLRLSLQAARRLAEQHDLKARVLDLQWLNPLPLDAIREQASEVGTVVVVDECRATGGGIADAVIADLAERRIGRRLGSVRAVDSFVPLGPATSAVLVGLDQVVAAAAGAVSRKRRAPATRS